MKNIVTGAVSLLLIAAMGWVMFATAPEPTEYSEKFDSVDQRLESLDSAMASQSDAINQLAADVATFKSGFDSGGSDESTNDESTWDDSPADPVNPKPINPSPTIDNSWSPGTFVSGGGSTGSYSTRVVSSSLCPCGPNCNCANVSSQPVYSTRVVSGGSSGSYSSAPSTTLFNRVRSAGPVIQRPIIQRPIIQRPVIQRTSSMNCANGQCYLN